MEILTNQTTHHIISNSLNNESGNLSKRIILPIVHAVAQTVPVPLAQIDHHGEQDS